MLNLGKQAKEASKQLKTLTMEQQYETLIFIADNLSKNSQEILMANQKDILHAQNNGITGALIDRLTLNEQRICTMVSSIKNIAQLPNPIGEMESYTTRPNGLQIGQKRVPLGVVGIIYEARPNVTIDAFALCFKTFNSVILRGGKEAFHTNNVLVDLVRKSLEQKSINPNVVQLVQDTSRNSAKQLMKMNQYLDVLIPRGGAGLIRTVVEESTVPVIETGVGNCHMYIDEFADLEKAVALCINSKTQRVGVCNSLETLIVHKNIAKSYLNKLLPELFAQNVEIRGDNFTQQWKNVLPVTEEDFKTEFLDYILAIKTVNSIEEAISHIEQYSTGHSEAIITENYTNAQRFLNEIDSAAVYVNASTRFTDGFEFGFGAEIGISTQKLHARGPMGLKALTTTKYIIFGDGQCRV